MSVALTEEEAAAVERETRQTRRLDDVLAEMRAQGVREGSIRAMRQGLERALSSSGDGDAAGMFVNGAISDPFVEAYLPEKNAQGQLVHDRRAALERDLKAGKKITLDVYCTAPDGRKEALSFGVAEARAYFEADVAVREGLRATKIRERRLTTAIDAAARLVKEGGRRAPIESRVTADEELCLREFGALEFENKLVPVNGTPTLVEASATIREGWRSKARAALRTRESGFDPRALRESWAYDFDSGQETGRGPTPLIGGFGDGVSRDWYRLYGPNQIQMMLNDVWDEQAKARFAYERDPFCKQGINIATNFVLGRGFSASAKEDIVQDEIDAFDLRHPQQELKRWLRSAKLMGDLFLWKTVLTNGRVQFKKIPAQTIWEIVTLADDVTVPLYYVQRYQTHFQTFAEPDNSAHYVERIIDAGDLLHFKRNAEEDEVRGRSDTYAALPWHHQFRNHWNAQIEKDYASAAHVFVAMVEGTAGAVQRFIATSIPKRRPAPGSYLVFNDKVKDFKVIKSDINQPSGTGSTNEGILNALAANYGFAKEYFGVSGNRSRGGAVVAEGPAEKNFENEQDDWGDLQRQLYQTQIDLAVIWGRIPPGTDTTFKVQFPNIIKGDSLQKAQLLVVARAQRVLSHVTFSNLFAAELDIGDDYDYQAEQDQIKAEIDQGIVPPPMPPKFDPIDPPSLAAPGLNGDLPDPRSAAGSAQIRQDDQTAEALDEATDDELAEELSARGHVVMIR